LLAITGLKAREILPYTLLLLLAGFIIFATLLWVF
jgi:short subunit fatty acids transporter